MFGGMRRLVLLVLGGPGAQRRIRCRALAVGDGGRLPVGDDLLCLGRCAGSPRVLRVARDADRRSRRRDASRPRRAEGLDRRADTRPAAAAEPLLRALRLGRREGGARRAHAVGRLAALDRAHESAALAAGDGSLRHGSGHVPRLGRRGRRRDAERRRDHGHRRGGHPAAAEPGRRKPAHGLQLRPAVVREQGGRPLRRLARLDAAGPLQLPRLVPALPEQLGLRQPEGGLRLHERPALVARQDGADDHRGRPAGAVRLDVDPDLEQPLEPEHVRRRPVAVQAADLVLVPPLRARVLGEARLGRRRTRTCTEWTSPGRRSSEPWRSRRR